MGFNAMHHSQIDADLVAKNASFWPDINVAEFQREYRIAGEYDAGILISRLQLGMLWANRQLARCQAEQTVATLADLYPDTTHQVGGLSPQMLHYRRAVCCYAKARLLQDYATPMRRKEAERPAMESEDTVDVWLANAQNAISDFLEKPRTRVELI